jgi:hypothetical protein
VKTRTIVTTAIVFATLSVAFATNANAKQHVVRQGGREIVVHSNPVPVFLHRLVPPNHGRHVTLKEYQSGKAR